MSDSRNKIKSFNHWALIVFLSMPFFYSCSSYQTKMDVYYGHLKAHQYEKALKSMEANKFLNHPRNILLKDLERGRLQMLNNNPKKSNEFLNAADAILESNYKTAKDVAVSNLTNPMMENYRGEDFEKLMVNYFKAINYVDLGETADALVEARRMTLATNRLSEKYKNKESRYSNDPFILNVQGMLYEMSEDWNNAFISYRNAADVYLAAGSVYYGVAIPPQLQQDLLYSAAMMGFTAEQLKYEELFQVKLTRQKNDAGELILFLEEGNAPVKEDNSIMITNVGGIGGFQYLNPYGSYVSIPFDHRVYGISDEKLSSIRTFKISLPSYKIVFNKSAASAINVNGAEYPMQLSQDFNTLAVSVLKERYLSEMAKAMARFLVKKLVEVGAEKVAVTIAENKNSKAKESNTNEAERKKNQERAENIGKAIGFLVNMANSITEKADTRSWLSLPAYISYIRLPLKSGENSISLNYKGIKKSILIQGNKGLQIKSIVVE